MRSRKKPCQPKTAKRFFGGSISQGPSGQAKERTRILPVRRGSFCPACRAIWRGWPFLRGQPAVMLAFGPVPRHFFCKCGMRAGNSVGTVCPACLLCAEGTGFFAAFFTRSPRKIFPFSSGVPLLCSRPAGLVTCCFFADFCAHCLFACSALFMRVSLSCFFALSCLTFSSQTSFHLSLRPRRGFPCLSLPTALFPARGSCHLLLFRRLLRPLPVCLFCIVYAGFLSLVFLPFPA